MVRHLTPIGKKQPPSLHNIMILRVDWESHEALVEHFADNASQNVFPSLYPYIDIFVFFVSCVDLGARGLGCFSWRVILIQSSYLFMDVTQFNTI